MSVQWVFDPDDQNGFIAGRDRLVADYVAADGDADAVVAEQVLDLKWQYLDGALVEWTAADVEDVLFDLYPAKVIIEPTRLGQVVPEFSRFLRFLATRTGRTDRALMALARVVDGLASRFVATMSDEDNWSFGKRMWASATASGVDLSDQSAVDAWVREFNARPVAERDQIPGPSLSPPGSPGANLFGGPLPPVVLAPEVELVAAAREAVLVQRLVRLVEFVGAGRPLTDRQNLRLADGKALVVLLETDDVVDSEIGGRVFKTRSSEDLAGVDWTFRIALAMRLLRFEGRRVVPDENAAWVPEQVLDLAYGALLVMLQASGPTTHHFGRDRYGFGWYAEELDRMFTVLLLDLYRDPAPTSIDDLAAMAWDELMDIFDFDDVPAEKLKFHRDSVCWSVRRAFDQLGALGIVAVDGETVVTTEYGTSRRVGGTVVLTPLGVWALQRIASRITDAPVVGALRERSAVDLLAQAADRPEQLARGEIDAWVVARDDAAAELCVALARVDETARGLGYRALLGIGASAADAVATLADDPMVREFVTVFRVDVLIADAMEMDRSSDPGGWIDLLATVIEVWGPQAAAAAWADSVSGASGIEAMLDRVWRVPGERTEVVLATVGAHHGDKRIAKAARKALFKFRSAG